MIYYTFRFNGRKNWKGRNLELYILFSNFNMKIFKKNNLISSFGREFIFFQLRELWLAIVTWTSLSTSHLNLVSDKTKYIKYLSNHFLTNPVNDKEIFLKILSKASQKKFINNVLKHAQISVNGRYSSTEGNIF